MAAVSVNEPRDAEKLLIRDLVWRNPFVFMFGMFIALVLAGLYVMATAKSIWMASFYSLLFGLLLTALAIFTAFFNHEAHSHAVYATLPVSHKRRERVLWFEQVILLPALLFGPLILVAAALAVVNELLLFALKPPLQPMDFAETSGLLAMGVVLHALVLSALMALGAAMPKIGRLAGILLSIALVMMFFLNFALWFHPGEFLLLAGAVCLLIIVLGYFLAVRRRPLWRLPSPMRGIARPLSFEIVFPERAAPSSLWGTGLAWAFRRLLVLALFLAVAVRYLTWFASEIYELVPERPALMSLTVSIAACGPFAYAAAFLWRRFKLGRSLPVSRTRLALAAYAYGLFAGGFSAIVTILAVRYFTETRLVPAFFIQSALLGLALGFLLPAPVFLLYRHRFNVQAASYLALGLISMLLIKRPMPLDSWPPRFTLLLVPVACFSAIIGFPWFCRVFNRADGRQMPAVLEKINVDF